MNRMAFPEPQIGDVSCKLIGSATEAPFWLMSGPVDLINSRNEVVARANIGQELVIQTTVPNRFVVFVEQMEAGWGAKNNVQLFLPFQQSREDVGLKISVRKDINWVGY